MYKMSQKDGFCKFGHICSLVVKSCMTHISHKHEHIIIIDYRVIAILTYLVEVFHNSTTISSNILIPKDK